MSWSYSGNPAASPLDNVRFIIGDTMTSDQLLSDEEINYALAEYPSTNKAAIKCCEAILAKFARECDTKIGPTQVWSSQRLKAYSDLLKALSKKGRVSAPAVSSIITTHDAIFSIDMMDNGQSTT